MFPDAFMNIFTERERVCIIGPEDSRANTYMELWAHWVSAYNRNFDAFFDERFGRNALTREKMDAIRHAIMVVESSNWTGGDQNRIN